MFLSYQHYFEEYPTVWDVFAVRAGEEEAPLAPRRLPTSSPGGEEPPELASGASARAAAAPSSPSSSLGLAEQCRAEKNDEERLMGGEVEHKQWGRGPRRRELPANPEDPEDEEHGELVNRHQYYAGIFAYDSGLAGGEDQEDHADAHERRRTAGPATAGQQLFLQRRPYRPGWQELEAKHLLLKLVAVIAVAAHRDETPRPRLGFSVCGLIHELRACFGGDGFRPGVFWRNWFRRAALGGVEFRIRVLTGQQEKNTGNEVLFRRVLRRVGALVVAGGGGGNKNHDSSEDSSGWEDSSGLAELENRVFALYGTAERSFEEESRSSEIFSSNQLAKKIFSSEFRSDIGFRTTASSSASGETHHSVKTIRIAVFGEHGPTNLDHATSLLEALRLEKTEKRLLRLDHDDPPSFHIEHYFSYKWNMEGLPDPNSQMRIHLSWEDFFEMPLTRSKGNRHMKTTEPVLDGFFGGKERQIDYAPKDVEYARKDPWTVSEVIEKLEGYLEGDEFFSGVGGGPGGVQFATGCEPFWLCAVLGEVFRRNRNGGAANKLANLPVFLPRLNMCPLLLFKGHFDFMKHPFPDIMGLMLNLMEDGIYPVSAACRLSSEMWAWVFRKEIPYVPFLGLHARPAQSWLLAGDEISGDGPVGSSQASSSQTCGKQNEEARNEGADDKDGNSCAVGVGGSSVASDGPLRPILVFRTYLPSIHTFLRMLSLLEEHYEGKDSVSEQKGGSDDSQISPKNFGPRRKFAPMEAHKNYPYSVLAHDYAAVVLLPHVPNALRLSDFQAMHVPIFAPGEPYGTSRYTENDFSPAVLFFMGGSCGPDFGRSVCSAVVVFR